MKKGRASSDRVVHRPVRAVVGVVGGELGSSLYRLLDREDKADGSSLRWRISLRTVKRPGVGGAFGSEYFAAAEHVPDRFREPASEVELGDLGAALLADPRFCLLVAMAVDGVGAGAGCGLDERPAQVARSLLAEWSAQVTFA